MHAACAYSQQALPINLVSEDDFLAALTFKAVPPVSFQPSSHEHVRFFIDVGQGRTKTCHFTNRPFPVGLGAQRAANR